MSGCVCCGQEGGGYAFRALEVRTIHLRELSGERRVQGLGALHVCVVCRDCAQKRLEGVLRPWGTLARQSLPFVVIFLLGAAVLGILRPAGRPIQFFGAAAVICGAVGVLSAVRATLGQRRAYSALPQEEALERAAWACAQSALPRKAEDADLTYIPLNQETLAMGVSQLIQRFDLLAPIAKEAAERMSAAR